jgi:hypothetical protein
MNKPAKKLIYPGKVGRKTSREGAEKIGKK